MSAEYDYCVKYAERLLAREDQRIYGLMININHIATGGVFVQAKIFRRPKDQEEGGEPIYKSECIFTTNDADCALIEPWNQIAHFFEGLRLMVEDTMGMGPSPFYD